uniref:Odorant receptor n=1 Tax=Meteorus pulchricornis TaxID=51522 RepID=A0A1S5VFS6_9HYME|nr:olfactory receptor 87 [Meteorus pulchricornis]
MRGKSKNSVTSTKPISRWENDIKNSTKISRWILTMLGIWQINRHVSIIRRILADIRVLICYSLIFFLLIPCALHTFFEEKDPHRKVKLFGPVIFYSMGMMKFSFLVARRKNISDCLDHMLVDWKRNSSTEDREIMIANAKISSFIATVCTIFSYSSAIFFRLIIPLTMGKRVTANNITIRPLGSPVYRPLFTAIESPSYEIVFTTQTISALLLYAVTVGACSLAAVFVLHACGQLRIVMCRLDSYVVGAERADDILERRMAEIVELHLRVLNFIRRIERLLNEVCLIEFVASIINICLMLYYMVTEFTKAETIAVIGYCVIVISFTFNIFILCYIGELLNEQVKNVGSTAYMIDWYKLPEKNAKGLILLLAMTNYPCRITAGKMAELSYRSFSGVLKTSMGYFNLLWKIAS